MPYATELRSNDLVHPCWLKLGEMKRISLGHSRNDSPTPRPRSTSNTRGCLIRKTLVSRMPSPTPDAPAPTTTMSGGAGVHASPAASRYAARSRCAVAPSTAEAIPPLPLKTAPSVPSAAPIFRMSKISRTSSAASSASPAASTMRCASSTSDAACSISAATSAAECVDAVRAPSSASGTTFDSCDWCAITRARLKAAKPASIDSGPDARRRMSRARAKARPPRARAASPPARAPRRARGAPARGRARRRRGRR